MDVTDQDEYIIRKDVRNYTDLEKKVTDYLKRRDEEEGIPQEYVKYSSQAKGVTALIYNLSKHGCTPKWRELEELFVKRMHEPNKPHVTLIEGYTTDLKEVVMLGGEGYTLKQMLDVRKDKETLRFINFGALLKGVEPKSHKEPGKFIDGIAKGSIGGADRLALLDWCNVAANYNLTSIKAYTVILENYRKTGKIQSSFGAEFSEAVVRDRLSYYLELLKKVITHKEIDPFKTKHLGVTKEIELY